MSTPHDILNIKWFHAVEPRRRVFFTVSGPNGHFTFKLGAAASKTIPGKKTIFISVLTGRDNENSYSYAGILDQSEVTPPTIIFTQKSKVTSEAVSIKAVLWAMGRIQRGLPFPAGYHCQHSGVCARCGRTLTTPESIAKGIGPECEKKCGW